MDFFYCKRCKNIITYVSHPGANVECCGEEMQRMLPNTVDAASEKHVPVISVEGNLVTVTVGSIPHPMTEPHHIAWLALETEKGVQYKALNSTGDPTAVFAVTTDDHVITAYEYCNLHGLWKV